MILQSGINLVAAHDRAECGGADADVVLPHWTTFVHGVEGGDTADIGRSQTQDHRACLNAGRRYPALDALHQMQHGQQCGTSLRIPRSYGTHLLQRRLSDLGLGDAVVQARLVKMRDEMSVPDELLRCDITPGMAIRCRRQRLEGVAQGAAFRPHRHRSTPPMTGSNEATATTTSETIPPSHIAGIACRLVKLGSRKCARNGRVPPSETTWAPSSPRGLSIGTYA